MGEKNWGAHNGKSLQEKTGYSFQKKKCLRKNWPTGPRGFRDITRDLSSWERLRRRGAVWNGNKKGVQKRGEPVLRKKGRGRRPGVRKDNTPWRTLRTMGGRGKVKRFLTIICSRKSVRNDPPGPKTREREKETKVVNFDAVGKEK